MTRANTNPLGSFFLAAVLAGIIFGLNSQQRLNWLITPVNLLAWPLRRPLVSLNLGIKARWEFLRTLPHQDRLIKDLKRQKNELAIKADRAADLERENAALKAVLTVAPIKDQTLLPVKVISLSRYAVIDQGSLAGIKPGLAVVSQEVLLGIIGQQVQPRTARVVLLTDPGTRLNARTASGTTGLVTYASGVLQLEQVLQKETLREEEPVFTQGSEDIPDGLLIGTLKKIDENPATVYKSATLEPASSIIDSQVGLVVFH